MTKEKIATRIVEGISNFTDIAVIGLSGGADSTLVAAMCKTALGEENVYGISMPYDEVDSKTFNARSIKLAKYLGINHDMISIYNAVEAISDEHANISPLNLGNIKSRMRMVNLYTTAGYLQEQNPDKRVRVIGTGNLSEDWIGYDTKGGDALADFFPIGELLKSEVYSLLDYMNIPENLIDRIPSAGLESGQTDEEDLGYSYNEMAKFVKAEFYGVGITGSEIGDFVRQRHNSNKHKHEAIPVFELRKFIDKI